MALLSIIIPVFNEEEYVKQSLENLAKVDFSKLKIDVEYIVVDDASTDNTFSIIKDFSKSIKKKNILIIRKEKNEGKGSAIKEGIKHAKGDIITIHDADLEYDPNDLLELSSELLKLDKSHAVYGTRFHGNNDRNFTLNYFANKALSVITSLLYKKKITDMETCYKMFYGESLQNIDVKSARFEFEPEITAKLLNKGVKIKEFPISYYPRNYDQGKKIKYKDGLIALKTLIKHRFFDRK